MAYSILIEHSKRYRKEMTQATGAQGRRAFEKPILAVKNEMHCSVAEMHGNASLVHVQFYYNILFQALSHAARRYNVTALDGSDGPG